MNIVKSSNYDQFDTFVGNRKVYPDHVNRLMKSIQQKNLLEENPIIVALGKIIDGQHRIEAARKLKIPFYYIEREEGTLDDIRRLNVYTKPWTLNDYLDSYIELGNENYMILADYMKRYGLPISVSVNLLTGTSTTGGSGSMNAFRVGKFTVIRLKEADEEAQALLKLKSYTEGNVWRKRDFITAMKKVWGKIDKTIFQEKVVNKGDRIRSRLSVKEYLRDLEDIYNFGLKTSQIRLYE